MSREEQSSSVFTDDSGSRARILQWGARGVLGAFAVVVVLVVLSLSTGVPLPGLGGQLGLPGPDHGAARHADQPRSVAPSEDPTSEVIGTGTDSVPGSSVAQTETPDAAGHSVPSPTSRPSSVPPALPTVAPTTPIAPAVTPTNAATKGPNASSTKSPRASPTKHAGGPPATPPGKSK